MEMISDKVYYREAQKRSSSRGSRPFTAIMPAQVKAAFNPYQTSYKHEYYRKDEPEEMVVRPPSHIKLDNSALRDETTYNKEYTGQRTTPNGRLWSGGNNPHPSEAFMVWKYPTRREVSGTEGHAGQAPVLTNDAFDKVMRGRCNSIYQTDYKGLPPGHLPSELANVPLDWKSSVPYTIDSAQRISYQTPNQPRALSNKTDRFGHSGHDRHKLLLGIAPNASKRIRTVKSNTTYDRHYNETAPLVVQEAAVHFPTHARTVVKGKGPDELAAIYEDLKRSHFPRHARSQSSINRIQGYTNMVPVTPDSGIPRVSPGTGIRPIPSANFVITPVPEPICEPV
ncbi:uncharacterized protein [Watersipora subatra]|uniref:uncharacterized protein n=1 Tax=Watersipora subatra TaxID=2589382 RepID=UPI00355ADE6B